MKPQSTDKVARGIRRIADKSKVTLSDIEVGYLEQVLDSTIQSLRNAAVELDGARELPALKPVLRHDD